MRQVFPSVSTDQDVSCLRTLSILAGCFYLLLAGSLGAVQQAEEAPPAARQNPVLREYFLKQYHVMHSDDGAPELFIDRFIDIRIDAFLEEVNGDLLEIDQLHLEVGKMRSELADPDVRRMLKKTLHKLGDRLGDLRRKLASIFLELKAKSKFREQPDESAGNTGYTREFQFLNDRIASADRRIRDYVFGTSPTVKVGDLKDSNLLVTLHEADQMAKRLGKVL